jgi:Flp pilus assembly protein TadD
VLPPDAGALSQVERLSELAVTRGKAGHWIAPYAHFARGLTEYRRGNYEAAEAMIQRALSTRSTDWVVSVPSQLVLAMTLHQRGRAKEAREALTEAVAFLNKKGTDAGGPAVGPNWPDWLAYQVLRREAEALIEGKKDDPKP